MSRWLDIARKADDNTHSYTGTQQEPSKRGEAQPNRGFLLVSNGCRVESAEKAGDAPPPKVQLAQQTPNSGPVPDKVGVGGRPVTWTGKVVSLEDWRNMTDWERHGPSGKMWNGKTHQWEPAK
ncbi:hypothetical protein [uncultured Ruegeria sp.]|uniref:hypothetical protein n=1 Tax=uncultured Ruegeria sp. TaxID=259304 RepID=UPI00261CB62D|nr:hypothetical protein [uncultured Ruegeria sp.]